VAISRVQFAQGGTNGTSVGVVATANFGSSVTSGNLIVVGVRTRDTNAIDSITDTLGTTYTLRVSANIGNDPGLRIYSGVPGSSGTNAVTVDFTQNDSYRWVFAIEYSPGGADWSDPYDTGDAETGTGVTDLVSGAISTAQAEEVVVLFATQGALTSYTAGTDFTLIDGTIGGEGQDFGGAEEYITSGTLSSYTAHITSGSTNGYTIAVAAFKTAGGGGGGDPEGSLIGGKLLNGGLLIRGVLIQ
jgi:hypothetical protein